MYINRFCLYIQKREPTNRRVVGNNVANTQTPVNFEAHGGPVQVELRSEAHVGPVQAELRSEAHRGHRQKQYVAESSHFKQFNT